MTFPIQFHLYVFLTIDDLSALNSIPSRWIKRPLDVSWEADFCNIWDKWIAFYKANANWNCDRFFVQWWKNGKSLFRGLTSLMIKMKKNGMQWLLKWIVVMIMQFATCTNLFGVRWKCAVLTMRLGKVDYNQSKRLSSRKCTKKVKQLNGFPLDCITNENLSLI